MRDVIFGQLLIEKLQNTKPRLPVLQGGFPTHAGVSVADPAQVVPLPDGAGLLQIRNLVKVPAPQVVLQGVELDHGPQLPLTFVARNNILFIYLGRLFHYNK